MSDNGQAALSSDDQTEKEIKSDTSACPLGDVNDASPSVRLFGQFKQNGFGFSNLSTSTFGQISSREKSDDKISPSTYFTSTLSKISSPVSTGFASSSTTLAVSLASLGANKPLFGGSSATTPSSFTDLKTTSTNSLQNKTDDEDGDKEEEEDDNNKASLLETVAEYEAKRASTHPATTIQGDTSTGEENEITKFHMAGKLFMYSGEQQQFIERGYGILKINENHDPSDWDRLQARIIMRLDKSFRVILNTPIFPKMTVERVTDRSVRFGAQDESQLRVFIIKASANDCNNLCKELQMRIQIIERQHVPASTHLDTSTNSSNTSVSSDVAALEASSPKRNSLTGQRKRSHSQSDSDTSDKTNDLSKKSKLIEDNDEIKKDANQSTSEDDSTQEATNS